MHLILVVANANLFRWLMEMFQVSERFEEKANGIDQEAAQSCKILTLSVRFWFVCYVFVSLNYGFETKMIILDCLLLIYKKVSMEPW